MNSNHTPGPWWTDGKYSADDLGIAIIAARTDCGPMPGNPTRGMVAWASEILPENEDRCKANARLIAAAPELLDALKDLLEAYSKPDERLCCDGRDCSCMGSTVHQQAEHYARAAIAKARGDMEYD